MNIEITANNFDLTDAIASLIRNKAKKLSHHNKAITDVHFFLTVNKIEHLVKIMLNIPRKETLCVQAKTHDMYEAIDKAIHSMVNALSKHTF